MEKYFSWFSIDLDLIRKYFNWKVLPTKPIKVYLLKLIRILPTYKIRSTCPQKFSSYSDPRSWRTFFRWNTSHNRGRTHFVFILDTIQFFLNKSLDFEISGTKILEIFTLCTFKHSNYKKNYIKKEKTGITDDFFFFSRPSLPQTTLPMDFTKEYMEYK